MRRLLNKSSCKECTWNITARYCSNTELRFQIKGNWCLLELSIRQWPLQIDPCGKDRQHHNWLRVSLTDQEHTACCFQPCTVQYDGYIVQSNTSLQTKAMCHCSSRNQQMGRKGTLFIYNMGSDDKHSLCTRYKCTSYKRVANCIIYPLFKNHIQIYREAPSDTNDNSNRNTSEDTWPRKHLSSKSHLNPRLRTAHHAPAASQRPRKNNTECPHSLLQFLFA